MNFEALENRVIELMTRAERLMVLLEMAEEQSGKRLVRLERLEEQRDDFDRRIAMLQETTAQLQELVHALNTNNQKLRRMIVGLVVVNLMALLLLSIVGIESLPFLVDAVRNMVL
jgi:chromosome segregation ATPase